MEGSFSLATVANVYAEARVLGMAGIQTQTSKRLKLFCFSRLAENDIKSQHAQYEIKPRGAGDRQAARKLLRQFFHRIGAASEPGDFRAPLGRGHRLRW